MNKIVALVLALSLMAAMVFAEPVVLASEIIQITDLISEADSNALLFADVEAPQLAALDAEQVEGGLGAGAIGGAILYGAVAVVGIAVGAYPSYAPASQSRNNVVASALYYGGIVAGMMATGAMVGAYSPF
jgi:hypothetical protein